MTSKQSAVLITGAGSGIGRELALKLNDSGKFVILAGRREEKLLETKERLANKENSEIFTLDLQNTTAIENFADAVSDKFFVSTLINNAGATVFKTVADTIEKEVEEIIGGNLTGTILLTKHFLPAMIKKRKGKIINILSVAANTVFTRSGIYSASKAGLLAFANVVREEIREFNVSVTNVLPGATSTPIWGKDALDKYSDLMMQPSDVAEIIISSTFNKSSAVVEELVVRPITGDIK